MNRYHAYILLCFFIAPLSLWAQKTWQGKVVDKNNQPLFAVNVYPLSDPTKGSVTDFEGNFSLNQTSANDSLAFSYIGYKTHIISCQSIENSPLRITLQNNVQELDEVRVLMKDPISKKFSVKKVDKMEIYLNPVSQGDALKSVTSLPASTSTDETANPSLRGSDDARSRVFLNGVPIYNPVRSTNLSNQGFFSIFNTELINEQYIYASNPPLTHGDVSAGMIDIQTQKNLEENQLQLSAGILNTGFLLSQKIKGDKNFIQLYGNLQFSNIYLSIQQEQLPDTKSFDSKDIGVYSHLQLSPNLEYSLYHYYLDEGYEGTDHQVNISGNVKSGSKRWFDIQSLSWSKNKWKIEGHFGYDTSDKSYQFDTMTSDATTSNLFVGGDIKFQPNRWLSLQTGVSHLEQNYSETSKNSFWMNMIWKGQKDPNALIDTKDRKSEYYGFANLSLNKNISFSIGLRRPINYHNNYTSVQSAVSIDITSKNHLLISGGKYYNTLPSSYYHYQFDQQESKQIAVDYTYTNNQTTIGAAYFIKEEKGGSYIQYNQPIDKQNIQGVEFSWKQNIGSNFMAHLANSWIQDQIEVDGKKYDGYKDLSFFIKSSLQYTNRHGLSVTLSYQAREGSPYTAITDHQTIHGIEVPIYQSTYNTERFNNYQRCDLMLSQYIPIKRHTIICFATINNLLNQKNTASIYYDPTFQHQYESYYTLRTFYAGVVWRWNYKK
ncbi:carboxypeptidase-like regulatory domain-containing protein [Halosquirtibacter xylanolyticus]|uniref:TonB-dependent receptor plug domain-containing protein n=1 Tax=Halosquirtibacter xylanolyticus TaxID=3374599 RepID=UPI0037493321|nr:carboxypeptidase-like regulatory domain-containing protein [Prolixibacteraceae bacterium]